MAKRIIEEGKKNRIILRLIGGLAIRFHCHGRHSAHLRDYHDIDLFALSSESGGIAAVFEKLGHYSIRPCKAAPASTSKGKAYVANRLNVEPITLSDQYAMTELRKKLDTGLIMGPIGYAKALANEPESLRHATSQPRMK